MKKIPLWNWLYLNFWISENFFVYSIENKWVVSDNVHIYYMTNSLKIKNLICSFTIKQQVKIKEHIGKIIDNDIKMLSKINTLSDWILILKNNLVCLKHIVNELI